MSPGISTRLLASQSDDRLLALVRQGHERAFEALVHRYRKPLLSYCRRLPLPDARAEDIIQLALLKTWIAVREGAEVRDVKAWLYRVVHNTAVNAVRDSAHDGEPLADPGERLGAAETDVDRRLAVREALTEVAALPPLQREVIVRTAVAGHSHEQVASDLGITNGAVRGLLYRARATLRTAVTALTPPPLLGWLAGRADQGGPAPERLTELAGGGGTVGIGGLLLKGGVVALTAGTVITGAAVVHIEGSSHHRNRHRLIASAPTGATETGPLVASTHPGGERGGRSVGLRSTRPAARRAHGHGGTKAHVPGGARSIVVGDGRGAPRSVAHPHRGGGGGAPGSGKTVQSTGTPGTTGQGSSPSGSGQSGESGQSGAGQSGAGQNGASGQGGASPGHAEPVGSAAGNGSGSGAGGSGSPGQGPVEGGGAPSGGQPGGSSGSGSSGSSSPEGSGGQGSSPSGSESSSGSGGGSGSLVGTVVHEVGSILEHVLH